MKLSWHILFLVLFTTSFSGLINYLLTQYQAKSLHTDSEYILAETIIQSLNDALVQDVIDGNQLRISNLLRNLADNDNPIEYIYVTKGHQSNVFAHSFKKGFPRYLLSKNNDNSAQLSMQLSHKYLTSRGSVFEYIDPLIPGLDITLHIGINQSEITEKLAKNTQYILEISVLTLLLSLLIAYLWSKKITSPLVHFTRQLKHYGDDEHTNFNNIKFSMPEIQLLATTFQKVTSERQQALNSLQEREQNLSITLNSIGDAVITCNTKGYVTHMNPIAEKLSGWSLQEAKGMPIKTIFFIVNAATRKPIINPVEKVITTGQTVHLSNHTTLIARDGTEYQIADSAAPILNKTGHILGMVLVFNNVTEQYHLREATKKAQQKLQSVFDDMQTMVYIMTNDGTVTFINNTPLQVCGLVQDDVLGKKIWDCAWFNYKSKVQAIIKSDCAEAASGHSTLRDIQIQTTQGLLWVEFSIHPIFDEQGKVLQLVPEARDISLRKQKEEQLQRSQKMEALGKLTGGVAHDYNNMLGIILGYAELLENSLIDQPEQAKYAQHIYQAGIRGAKLTKKLLAFSSQRSAPATLLNINTLLKNIDHLLEKTLTVQIKLEIILAETLWQAYLDSSELEDAIINIALNAKYAMNDRGTLTIKTANKTLNTVEAHRLGLDPGDYVLLSIKDTGCGMNKESQEKLFEPFYTTKGSKGTGLGLSQVHGFVKRSKGHIKVYSEQGEGTQFELYFPRQTDEPINQDQLIKKTEIATDTIKLKGTENILIVDDEQELLNFVNEFLSLHGYHVFRAKSGQQALDIIKNEAIDLILSDVIMPEMDGYQLANIIKEKYPCIKIQLASGFSDDRHINAIDKTLHQNLLNKPYNLQLLLKRLRKLLEE